MTTWLERAQAGGLAVVTGLAFQLSWSGPIPDLLAEAIRRAEAGGC